MKNGKDFQVFSNRKVITTLREPMLLSKILNVHTSREQSIKFDLKTQTANCISIGNHTVSSSIWN